MVRFAGWPRRLGVLVSAALLSTAATAVAIDTGRRRPAPPPPDVVNCGDRATSETCFECEAGGPLACCWDPSDCIVVDATSGAGFYAADGSFAGSFFAPIRSRTLGRYYAR